MAGGESRVHGTMLAEGVVQDRIGQLPDGDRFGHAQDCVGRWRSGDGSCRRGDGALPLRTGQLARHRGAVFVLAELRDGHVNLSASHDYGRYWSWFENYPTNLSDSLLRIYMGTDYKMAAGLDYRILDAVCTFLFATVYLAIVNWKLTLLLIIITPVLLLITKF